jgi:tetratricopeptide (TPR) repeat protein
MINTVRKNLSEIFCLVLIGLMAGCKPSRKIAEPPHYFKTHFQDESQFIVEAIVADLAEQVFYAKNRRLPDPKYFLVSATEKPDSQFATPSYELQINLSRKKRLTIELDVNGPIWSPKVYDGVTTALAEKVGLESTASSESENTDLLKKLADGTAATIEQENQKLSKALENDFSNPVLHEEAAVLLGAFTLREHSGVFYEIRSPLCRLTGHLAMARYFGTNSSGVNGQVAEAMLLTLMNNQTAALEKLSDINTNNATLISWVRALQARNTGDYRPLDNLNGLSQVESVEWFHALCLDANKDIAWSKLSDVQKKTPDFVRIANTGGFSVGLGHDLLALSLPLELEEIGTVYELSHDQTLKRNEIINALNQMPERCFSIDTENHPHVRIIGWGQWALFFQRHLCDAVVENFYFMDKAWGVPDDAKAFSAKCDKFFGGLRLYPFVQRLNCKDVDSYHKAVDAIFRITVETPQLVPAGCWNYLWYSTSVAPFYAPNQNPHITEWHKHNPPPGTAYNPGPRLNQRSLINRPDSDALVEKLHELAPYDENFANSILKTKYHSAPTYEQASALFQPVLPYANYAMEAVANTVQDQPDKYELLLAKAAELSPADYFTLADYFKDRKEEDKAAGYYEKANKLDPDAVQVANGANWLVQYYLKKGQIESARRLADFAGEVYSYSGLATKAQFLEDTGDYNGAFEWFSKIEERYNDSGPVVAFCNRYKDKTGDTRFDGELQKRIGNLFPKGIEKVSIDDFQSPPADGVLIQQENDLVRAAGLKSGDVIVVINGIRVHNFAQYSYERERITNSELDLIVWQNDNYGEIKASPPNHRFGVDFGDYVAK